MSEGGKQLFEVDFYGRTGKGLGGLVCCGVRDKGDLVFEVKNHKLSVSSLVSESKIPPETFCVPLTVELGLNKFTVTLVRTEPTQPSPLGWTCLSK